MTPIVIFLATLPLAYLVGRHPKRPNFYRARMRMDELRRGETMADLQRMLLSHVGLVRQALERRDSLRREIGWSK